MLPVPRLQLQASRAGTVRWRRVQIRLAVPFLVVVIGLVLADGAGGRTQITSGNRVTATTEPDRVMSRSAATKPPSPVDPLTINPVRALLARRSSRVSAAVEDLRTGREWTLNPGARDQTASIVKVNILEALLYQAQQADTRLSSGVSDTAQGMIEAPTTTTPLTYGTRLARTPGSTRTTTRLV